MMVQIESLAGGEGGEGWDLPSSVKSLKVWTVTPCGRDLDYVASIVIEIGLELGGEVRNDGEVIQGTQKILDAATHRGARLVQQRAVRRPPNDDVPQSRALRDGLDQRGQLILGHDSHRGLRMLDDILDRFLP